MLPPGMETNPLITREAGTDEIQSVLIGIWDWIEAEVLLIKLQMRGHRSGQRKNDFKQKEKISELKIWEMEDV